MLWDYLSRTLPSLVSYVQSLIFTSTLIARQWGLGPLFPFLLTRETESKTKCKDKWWKTRERNKRRCQKVCTHGKCWQQSQSFPFTPHLPCVGAKEDHLWLTEKQSWASSAPTRAFLGSPFLPPLIHNKLKYKTSLRKEFMEQAQVFLFSALQRSGLWWGLQIPSCLLETTEANAKACGVQYSILAIRNKMLKLKQQSQGRHNVLAAVSAALDGFWWQLKHSKQHQDF